MLVQPARFAAAENRRGDIRVGVAGLENGRRNPGHVHARQLDPIADGLPPFSSDRRRLHRNRRHVRSPFERTEVLLNQPPRRSGIDVADDRQARVVGGVVLFEELLHVVEPRRLDVRVRPDHGGVVRVLRRKQLMEHRLFDDTVGLVFHALAPFVADDILLIRECRAIHLVEQVTHAVGLDPQGELELI